MHGKISDSKFMDDFLRVFFKKNLTYKRRVGGHVASAYPKMPKQALPLPVMAA